MKVLGSEQWEEWISLELNRGRLQGSRCEGHIRGSFTCAMWSCQGTIRKCVCGVQERGYNVTEIYILQTKISLAPNTISSHFQMSLYLKDRTEFAVSKIAVF